jgi:diacylglycerol kinase family enzyme
MRVSLVHNTKSGGAQPSRDDLEALFREHGHEVVRYVGKKDDWTRMLADPGDAIVAAGGDGTVGAVARRMVRHDVPLLVLPFGTANNIAGTLGIQGSMQDVVESWATAKRVTIDLGIASGSWGKSWFVEGFGLGLLASGMAQLKAQDKVSDAKRHDTTFKLMRDRLAMKGLAADYAPMVLKGSLDGEDLSGEFLLVEAMNLRSVGPALQLAPDADPGDGALDFVFVPASHRADFMEYLASLQEGTPMAAPAVVRRGRELRLAGNGHDFHIDDHLGRPEPAPADAHLDIGLRVDAQAVQVLVPAVQRSAAPKPGPAAHADAIRMIETVDA